MKNISSIIITLLCSSLLLVTSTAHADWQQPELGSDLTAMRAPVPSADFELLDMDEEKVKLSDYRGKVVLLNFWATWCPPCIREMPSMEHLHQQLDADDFEVIAVNQMEDGDQVFAFTGQLEVDPTFPILFDTSSEVSMAYGVRGLPTTYLLDKQGNIRYRAVGGREFNHPEVVKVIKQLIEE